MRLPDEKKRRQICAVAARLFASRPFHEVRLDDVAAAAKVGKGTLYVYFKSKDDLYVSLVYEGFAAMVDRLRGDLAPPGRAPAKLESVVRALADFGWSHPHVFELIRRAGVGDGTAKWNDKRRELSDLIEGVIRTGAAAGELRDDHPELTALFIPGFVRSAVLFGPCGLDRELLVRHILTLLTGALAPPTQRSSTRG